MLYEHYLQVAELRVTFIEFFEWSRKGVITFQELGMDVSLGEEIFALITGRVHLVALSFVDLSNVVDESFQLVLNLTQLSRLLLVLLETTD